MFGMILTPGFTGYPYTWKFTKELGSWVTPNPCRESIMTVLERFSESKCHLLFILGPARYIPRNFGSLVWCGWILPGFLMWLNTTKDYKLPKFMRERRYWDKVVLLTTLGRTLNLSLAIYIYVDIAILKSRVLPNIIRKTTLFQHRLSLISLESL